MGQSVRDFFEPYQLVFKAKKNAAYTDRQKKYLKDLMVYHKIEMNFNIDELSKNEASKKIDKILSEKGKNFWLGHFWQLWYTLLKKKWLLDTVHNINVFN